MEYKSELRVRATAVVPNLGTEERGDRAQWRVGAAAQERMTEDQIYTKKLGFE